MLKIKQYAYSALGYRSGINANEYGVVTTYSKSEALDLVAGHFYKTRGYRATSVDVTEIPELTDRVNYALNLAVQYGGIEGDHHKTWVIDRMVRALAEEEYDRVIAESRDGEDGPNTNEWGTGIAP